MLRRPPLAHVLPTAHDMAREYRVIAALHPTGFPVPVPLHLCQDPEPIGAPFYLMSYVDGRVLRASADLDTLAPETCRHAGEILVDTLVALHATEPAAIGLADFGRPDGYLERQVRRWHQQWEASKTRELATLEECAERLRKEVPTPARATIVHGDYRLDNVMVDHDVRRILAVLDWEMATLGDPLADLGLLVVYTKLAADGLSPTQPVFGPDQGFLSAEEMVDRYGRLAPDSGAVDQIGWYVALGYYKLAIISEGIHARFLMGMTVGEGFDAIGRTGAEAHRPRPGGVGRHHLTDRGAGWAIEAGTFVVGVRGARTDQRPGPRHDPRPTAPPRPRGAASGAAGRAAARGAAPGR